ncbi:SDR family NAD(P)-dependent oxidoreductase, partial [Streptomyces sp. ISL-14]|nr:SDR family NAD(P)-dependent oxidoreductase [Streptomyces sp. ISL-14]
MVGTAALLPGATDVEGFWRNVVTGRDLMTDVPTSHWLVDDYFDPDPAAPDKTYVRRGAFLPTVEFDPLSFGVPPNTVPATDTTQLLSLMVAEALLDDLGPDWRERTDPDRVGVVLGSAALELIVQANARLQRPVWRKALREAGLPERKVREVCDRIADHYVPWQEATFPGALANVVAGRIANRFDLHGGNHTTDAACASSLAAVSTACAELSTGRTDMVLTGGVDTFNDITMFMCFSKTPALSRTGDCRPFSADADGTMLGEGLAMLALKRLSDAERDGDRVHAVIRGIGSSSDGGGTAVYAPVAQGQARALRRAYEQAGYGPGSVELVEAHGTGTRAGDQAEIAALRTVFADDTTPQERNCALGSVKSQLGHTKSAAGAVGLLKTVLALRHKVLPPTIKVDRPNPALDGASGPFYVNTVARPWVRGADHARRASVSSFGFGGSNFHVTLEEYRPSGGARAGARLRTAPTELVLLSAGSPTELVDRASSLDTDGPLQRLARRTQREFRPDAAVRLAVLATDAADLRTALPAVCDRVERCPQGPLAIPGRAYYQAGPPDPGQLAFLFPGQGAQYVGMGADLAMSLDRVQRVWDQHAGTRIDGRPLHRLVFPPPAFGDEERAAQQELLTATEWAQPALAVHSLALLEVLGSLGLRPESVAGHSFGEVVALHAAGCLDADALVPLGRARGEAMRDAAGEPGGMLAVSAPIRQVEETLAGIGPARLHVAGSNAPDQTVLAGPLPGLALAEQYFRDAGTHVRRLRTAAAFHTPMLAEAVPVFAATLQKTAVHAPGMPVYGNADAQRYPDDARGIRQRLAQQLVSPVRFTDMVESMYADGARTFLEVGAGSALTGLTGSILRDRPHTVIALDHPDRHGLTVLQEAQGRLAVAGFDLNHEALWEDHPAPRTVAKEKPRMTLELNGANSGRPYPAAGGAAALPPPQPEHLPDLQVPEPPAPRHDPAHAPTATPGAAWVRVIEEAQRQTAEVHTVYQRTMAETHLAFLRSSEASFAALFGLHGRVPQVTEATASLAPATLAADTAPATQSLPPRPAVTEPTRHAPGPGHPAAQARPTAFPDAVHAVLPTGPAAPAEAAPADSGPSGQQSVEEVLLSVVADRTGYPADMLSLDMELATDLGIDSIKRIEIFAALRRRINGFDGDLSHLSTLPTLRQIADELGGRPGGARPPEDAAPKVSAALPAAPRTPAGPRAEACEPEPLAAPAPEPENAGHTPPCRAVVEAAPCPPTGLAMPGLRDVEVVVTDDGHGLAVLVADRLKAQGVRATAVDEVPSDARGVVLLGGMGDPGGRKQDTALHRAALDAARTVASAMEAGGGVFVTVQDTGGDFGLDGRQGDRAWLGGLAGLARVAAYEWPAASVRSIDCERGHRTPDEVADRIVSELLQGGPTLDVGLRADGTRLVRRFVEQAAPEPDTTRFGPHSVVVASGGGRGATAAALRELAHKHRPRMLLLGRTPLDEPAQPADADDETSLVRALAALRPSAAPAELAAEARRVLAARETAATLEDLRRAGSTVRYAPVDVTDAKAVADAVAEIRAEWGPVTALVHGAGTIAPRRIPDKTEDQFTSVFGTKVDGLRSLLAATADDPLEAVFLFSSIAGCFGTAGQADYAMANEVLTQVASAEQRRRPGCVVRAAAWGPWDTGMAAPSAVAAQFARAGVELLPRTHGARAFLAELEAPAGVASRPVITAGDPLKVAQAFIAATGAPTQVSAQHSITGGPPAFAPAVGDPPAGELTVDPAVCGYLSDHAPAGVPILPMAIVLDTFCRAARSWQPDREEFRLEEVRVYQKVTLPPGETRRLRVSARPGEVHGPGGLEVELRGEDGAAHYRAALVDDAERAVRDWALPEGLPPFGRPDPYESEALFHGPAFRALRAVHGLGPDGAVAEVAGVQDLAWPDEPWQIDPAAVDAALQLALLWGEHV